MKPDPLTNEQRKQQARSATKRAITREMLWAAIGTQWWPSYLFPPRIPQKNSPWMLCIESPAGPIVYRLWDDDRPLFEHLERRERGPEHYQTGDKDITLLALATEHQP